MRTGFWCLLCLTICYTVQCKPLCTICVQFFFVSVVLNHLLDNATQRKPCTHKTVPCSVNSAYTKQCHAVSTFHTQNSAMQCQPFIQKTVPCSFNPAYTKQCHTVSTFHTQNSAMQRRPCIHKTVPCSVNPACTKHVRRSDLSMRS
jgi:hypothetical protein